MAKKYEDFDYQDYVNKRQPQLDTLYNQYTNFDSVYDPSKDTGLQTAKNQLMSEANVLASKERGRMGNRIGAISTSMQNASDSIYADALKNSQNLIGTYRDAAYNKQYNNLLNQYNLLYQQEQDAYTKYLNDRNLAFDEHTNEQNFNYQEFLRDLNGGSTGSTGTSTGSSVPSYVTNKLDTISSNGELEKYLDQLELSGVISQAQADALYVTYLSGVSSGTTSSNSGGSSVDKIYGPLTLEEWKKKKNAK